MIDAFPEKHTALRIDLSVTTRRLQLDRLESDIAIRPSDSPPEHFIGRRREEHVWLIVSDGMSAPPPGRWMEAFVPPGRRVFRADTFVAIAEACRLGRGVAMLPKADAQPGCLIWRRWITSWIGHTPPASGC